MIVPSMTIQEIHKEVFNDIKSLGNKVDGFKKDFERIVLKSTSFPVIRTFSCVTIERKNKFSFTFTARKRSERRTPILGIYGVYTRKEGVYAASLTPDMKITTIYPPHFFQRFRERILKDNTISNEKLINLYFKEDWGFAGAVIDEDYKSVFYNFENSDPNEKISFVGATSLGYCFGEKQGQVNIIKTIISEEMLFDNQKQIFFNLREQFNKKNKERFG